MTSLESIQEKLDTIEQDKTLSLAQNIPERADVLHFLGLVDQVVRLRRRDHRWGMALPSLKRRSAILRQQIQTANADFFQDLQDQIRSGKLAGHGLRQFLNQYTAYRPSQADRRHMGYDGLDLIVNGLIDADNPPDATRSRDAEMVHLESTPARAVLDMIDQAGFTSSDVFYDIGSGLGNVAMVVRLLTGAIVKGIEYEPAYCQHAQQRASNLGLKGIDFISVDARAADYSAGTVFFMFTPFTGEMLTTVLERLRQEAERRPIALCTYGTITLDVAQQSWLSAGVSTVVDAYSLAIFRNRNNK